MTDAERRQRRLGLLAELTETRVRIRRYTLDPRLKESEEWRTATDEAWAAWLAVRDRHDALPGDASDAQVGSVERELLDVSRKVDVIQRELVSEQSFDAGRTTVVRLALALLALAAIYLWAHGVRSPGFEGFETLPLWGPVKYVEVAFWSLFGVLVWLLFLSARYVARRDYDRWYGPWYLATALRAPFIAMVLMVVVLEFIEWYAEDKALENYILDEGNKFFFMVVLSFCLGLMSDQTSRIMRELADGVLEFIRAVVTRFSRRLSSFVTQGDANRK